MPHQYAFDAGKLLVQCLDELHQAFPTAPSRQPSLPHLTSLKEALLETEKKLLVYFQECLDNEQFSHDSSLELQALFETCPPTTLTSSMRLLKLIKKHRRKSQEQQKSQSLAKPPSSFYEYPQRTTIDSQLFKLITILQICHLRIRDANLVLAKHQCDRDNSNNSTSSVLSSLSSLSLSTNVVASCMLGLLVASSYAAPFMRSSKESTPNGKWFILAAKVGLTGAAFSCLHWSGSHFWTASKITSSTSTLEEWNRQWTAIQPRTPSARQRTASAHGLNDTEQARLLVEFALKEPKKTSLWRTSGELRFFMLKRAMDIFYASVEKAMEVTNARSASDWQLLGATAAAASFYSTPGTGASQRVASITSSSQAAGDLIRNAWGMVSLPAVKNLSLQASRFLKGAAVADRIEICGVSCFVLSTDPAPELATSIDSYKRMTGMTTAPSLATIQEGEEHTPTATCSSKPFARSMSLSRFRQRDVIFHLTGGGFFAHIIASDLPYLLDWSSATGAVVICPEYALLPEHCFPDALHQITDVYSKLVRGDAASQLGFEVNRIIVTGESAGGNLASALCIKLSRQAAEEAFDVLTCHEDSDTGADVDFETIEGTPSVRFPDALMLCCPVLNLSSELSPSRMSSTRDPVMPGSVISAISNAYIPRHLGISRKDPLVSPIFASNDSLKLFPPTLLFASSNDPVLDDSVIFNRRLRGLGVDSELQVADNLPHAYLGLGTTGFPEAVQVQKDCQSWLSYQFTRNQSFGEVSSSSLCIEGLDTG